VEPIEERVKRLPPELRQEVEDFMEFLLARRVKRPAARPRFTWAGALKDLKDQYTSVDLQHKIARWRVAEE